MRAGICGAVSWLQRSNGFAVTAFLMFAPAPTLQRIAYNPSRNLRQWTLLIGPQQPVVTKRMAVERWMFAPLVNFRALEGFVFAAERARRVYRTNKQTHLFSVKLFRISSGFLSALGASPTCFLLGRQNWAGISNLFLPFHTNVTPIKMFAVLFSTLQNSCLSIFNFHIKFMNTLT